MRKGPSPAKKRRQPHTVQRTVDQLRDCVLRLDRAQAAGALPNLLGGRRLGLLCAGPPTDFIVFEHAAADLGASASVLTSDLQWTADAQQIEGTARLLSRLYDAVTCDGLPEAVVARLASAATIPVTSGYAGTCRQLDVLADKLGSPGDRDHRRRRVLQALVVLCMG
jgi:ornithine carbamoyltransferase